MHRSMFCCTSLVPLELGLLLFVGGGFGRALAADAPLLMFQQGHLGAISSVAFHPGGKIFATGSKDRTVKLWDAESGKLLRTLTGHSSDVNSVTFSPDGKTLASGSSDRTVRIWDVRAGLVLRIYRSAFGRGQCG